MAKLDDDFDSKEQTEDQAIIAERGKRLREIREVLLKVKRPQLANKYNLSSATLRSWEDGLKAGLTQKGAKTMVDIFRKEGVHCTVGWLLFGNGIPPKISSGGIESSLVNIKIQNAAENNSLPVFHDEIDYFHSLNRNSIHLKIIDDGMEPYYVKGDYVAGIKQYDEQIDSLIGKFCIVETEMGDLYCRLLRPGSQIGLYNLVCVNSLSTTSELLLQDIELVSAAEVTRHWKKESR